MVGRPFRDHAEPQTIALGTPRLSVRLPPRHGLQPESGRVGQFHNLRAHNGRIFLEGLAATIMLFDGRDVRVRKDDHHLIGGGETLEGLDQTRPATSMERNGHAAILHRPRAWPARTKKGAAPCGTALFQVYFAALQLDLADVDRLLFAVVARGHLELDGLTLVEGLEAIALDLGEVDEHVVAALLRDEAVALVRVEPLDSTVSH